MSNDVIGFLYRLQWVGHDAPPNGVRVLLEKFVPGSSPRCPPEIEAAWQPGTGYSVCVGAIEKPLRRQSPERVGRLRRDKLRKRLERDYPLFAEQMYAEALAAKPDYYAGRNPNDDKVAELERCLWEQYERYAKIAADAKAERARDAAV